MGRFRSKEEYERWRATQAEDTAAANPETPPEKVYDGPAPGSREFSDQALRHSGLATEREKNLAMLCHLTALIGFIIPFGNLLGPVAVWMAGKANSSFVDEHGKASLNFQISLTLFSIAAVVMALFLGPLALVLFLVLAISVVYGVVMIIVNAVRAHNGDDGAYALSTRFLR